MKSNEILSALKLTKSKDAMSYCNKLASLFTFLKVVKIDLIDAAKVETGLTMVQRYKTLSGVKRSLLKRFNPFND